MPRPSQPLDLARLQFLEHLLEQSSQDARPLPEAWRRELTELADGAPRRESNGREPRDAQRLQQQTQELELDRLRERGHLQAELDPLSRPRAAEEVRARDGYLMDRASAKGMLERLKAAYSGSLALETAHIDDAECVAWIRRRYEELSAQPIPQDQTEAAMRWLAKAAVFEEFMRKKYVGAKVFSLEGAEVLIPMLHQVLDVAGAEGVAEVVVAMAHRGRLNVLSNFVGRPAREVFCEFEDRLEDRPKGGGDVPHHLGASGDVRTRLGAEVHVSLCFNPSHLEFVSPIALGRLRAKQDRVGDRDRRRGLALLIHGDASFAGEGVVQETLNLAELPAYAVGGAVHILINNQLGFTTDPSEGRSGRYATNVARMLRSPIFHINGEDWPSVWRAVTLGLEFRQRYQRDVFLDLYCYRRWGHNEVDEPEFTQPAMYRAISALSSRKSYVERIVASSGAQVESLAEVVDAETARLAQELGDARNERCGRLENASPQGVWAPYLGGLEPPDDNPDTGIDAETAARLLHALTQLPEGLEIHPRLANAAERRRRMADGVEPLDWAAAEALAIASLASDGHPVRLSGQDTQRGTFSQRHAVLHDRASDARYEIFSGLAPQQATVEVFNTPLSEVAALGFEYGYSLDFPEALVAWEAQFGDFVNVAQVVIDQFLASAEEKWNRLSGLVMLLPHGHEGQGPEHSSARLERFLSLAANDNLQVVQPTTPAQYFHCLRRQVLRRWRKPLIVLTPKSLLRRAEATSPLSELSGGRFAPVLAEARRRGKPPRLALLCSGKIYYDLDAYRREHQRRDVAILRIEQLYPYPDRALASALQKIPPDAEIRWVQEEPENMGAAPDWKQREWEGILGQRRLQYVARPRAASPATGSASRHRREQQQLIERAFESPSRARAEK